MEGLAAETSGGLLICIPQHKKQQFVKELAEVGINSWEIGEVREGRKTARL